MNNNNNNNNNPVVVGLFLQPSSRSSRASGWACRVMSPAGGGATVTSCWRWRGQLTTMTNPQTDQTETFLNSENKRTHAHTHAHTHTAALLCYHVDLSYLRPLTFSQSVNKPYMCLYLFTWALATPPPIHLISGGVRVQPAPLKSSVSFICTKMESSSHSRCVYLPALPPPPPPPQWKWWWRSFESEG